MNDRYSFRARAKAGEWFYGDLLRDRKGVPFQIQYLGMFWGEPVAKQANIIPETVGQCTGLYDKNGKLIYEGDILSRSGKNYKKKYVVCWAEYYWTLRCESISESLLMNIGGINGQEIIGNIHDNPELVGDLP